MNKLNYARIFAVLAFLGLAGFSCYWTSESLFIWQPGLTIWGAWFLAIVCYVMASFCFSALLKTFDRNQYFGDALFGRGGQMLLAIVGLIFCWLIVSMPTNTHTLLYNTKIKATAQRDLERTQNYLKGLKDNNLTIKKIKEQYNIKEQYATSKIQNLIDETENPTAPGIAHRFEQVLIQIEKDLNFTIQRNAKPGHTKTEWQRTVTYYANQIRSRLSQLREERDKQIVEIRRNINSETTTKIIDNLSKSLSEVHNMTGVDNSVIDRAQNDLHAAYPVVKSNSKYIVFKNVVDRNRYTRENPTTEIEELRDITGVWYNYLTTDKYDGHGFIYWILLALIVDVSGFIFFRKAFN